MCHCFTSVDELTERDELLEEHTVEELRAEYTDDELEKLDVAV